jgi:predicted Fe-Mo cluster-binding NifX family protein
MKKKYAVPTQNRKLCAHFGHCENFAVLEVEDGAIVKEEYLTPPAHQPGSYPAFLASRGVNTIIAGGMGAMAQNLFAQNGIEVVMGVGSEEPSALVVRHLQKELESGQNLCDSDHGHDHEGHCHHP